MPYFEPQTYSIQNAGRSWSYATDGNKMRFELRPGDRWKNDSDGVERSEVGSFKTLAFNQTYSIQYKFMIEPGQLNAAKWLVIGQFHATEDEDDEGVSPPYELTLVGERMQINARWSASAQTNWGNVHYQTLYADTQNIQRGHWYDIKIDVRFDPFGNGILDVWRDGVQLVDCGGPLGYNDQIGPYWKQGVYRKASSETIAVNYSDFTLTNGNAAPTDIGLSQSSVPETAPNETIIGELSAQDPNAGDTFTYTLLSHADERFALDATGTKLVVLDGSKLDYEKASSHAVTVRVTDQNGSFYDETLTIAVRDVSPETNIGSVGHDVFVGGKGNDVFQGGLGQDRLTGGRGADKLWGGAGADSFIYSSARDSTVSAKGRDTIYDSSAKQGDKVSLHDIDANTTKKGNQGFSFIGKADFHHKAGELRYEKIKGGILASADVNGNGKADLAIVLKSLTKAEKDYFIL